MKCMSYFWRSRYQYTSSILSISSMKPSWISTCIVTDRARNRAIFKGWTRSLVTDCLQFSLWLLTIYNFWTESITKARYSYVVPHHVNSSESRVNQLRLGKRRCLNLATVASAIVWISASVPVLLLAIGPFCLHWLKWYPTMTLLFILSKTLLFARKKIVESVESAFISR